MIYFDINGLLVTYVVLGDLLDVVAAHQFIPFRKQKSHWRSRD